MKSDIGQLIEFEPPLQVLEVKYERIRITKSADTEDENGKYKIPIYENGNPVFATPEDEEYYEFLNFIGNSNSTLFVETDDPIGMITLTYKLYSEETINYYIQGVSINREADERRTAYRCKFSEHPLRFSPELYQGFLSVYCLFVTFFLLPNSDQRFTALFHSSRPNCVWPLLDLLFLFFF